MIRYKIKKVKSNYVLYRYIIHNNSVGFYKVVSGTNKMVRDYLKENNIRIGVNYER